MTLTEAFHIGEREVISLVGGGGKTALLYALGRELAARRSGVILTTTTKIREPAPLPFLPCFISADFAAIRQWVTAHLPDPHPLLIARARLSGGKLEGIPPEWVGAISALRGVGVIVNEADGAAGRPLKAPRAGEPVIPGNTTLLVPVVGIDGVDRPLDEETVFRSAIAARLLGLPMGGTVTGEAIARLVMASVEGAPSGARVVPLLNKVDIPGGLKKARQLARCLIAADPVRIRRVVLGQLQRMPAVKEVMEDR